MGVCLQAQREISYKDFEKRKRKKEKKLETDDSIWQEKTSVQVGMNKWVWRVAIVALPD